jgi:hypothetical protein
MGYKFHIWKKKKNRVLVGSHPGRLGHGLTRQFDRVVALTGFLPNPGRPGPGSARRAGPGLKTLQ